MSISTRTPAEVLETADAVRRNAAYYRHERLVYLALSLAGAIFALSSPGLDQWYIAWFGLIPLLAATFTSSTVSQAFYRAVFFGYAYNLIYNNFMLNFDPLVWPEGLRPYTAIANSAVWILVAMQQGALYGTFASVLRYLPLTGGLVPLKQNGRLLLPAMLVVPLVYVLIFNKLGNHLSSVAVPWSLIEYSQYQCKELIQIASIAGGIGISFLIVMANTFLLSLFTSIYRLADRLGPPFPSRASLISSLLVLEGILVASLVYGACRLGTDWEKPVGEPVTVSVLQGNLLFGLNEIDPKKHFDRYQGLAAKSPPGICVWPEWSMPVPVSTYPEVFDKLGKNATAADQDWLIGAVDEDEQQRDGDRGPHRTYNAAAVFGKTARGHAEIYRKRYLVPFGEHTPAWILNSPLGGLCGTLTPRREGFSEGRDPVVFTVRDHKIAPLICCELISPELAADSVRQGGEILVDSSNTMWFQTRLLGDQSIAVAVLRAVENHRYFVFGTSIGPSAFVDARGRVLKRAPLRQTCSLTQEVQFFDDTTPFIKWFR